MVPGLLFAPMPRMPRFLPFFGGRSFGQSGAVFRSRCLNMDPVIDQKSAVERIQSIFCFACGSHAHEGAALEFTRFRIGEQVD